MAKSRVSPILTTAVALLSLLVVLVEYISRPTGDANAWFATGTYEPVSGSMGPVLVSTDFAVEGLQGAFIRNGPNPIVPVGHWFDGHGYVHAVVITNNSLIYTGHQLETGVATVEAAAHQRLYIGLGDVKGRLGFFKMMVHEAKKSLGLLPHLDDYESGPANTAFGVDESRRRIYALVESDHPFEIGVSRTGSVVSVGYESFGGNLFHAVSAHAKYDSKAQEWLLAGYDLSSKSRDAAFSVVSKEGTLQRTMNFTLPWKTFMHDWAATATRGIFIVTSSQFAPENMIVNDGHAFIFNRSATAKFGVFPRDASDPSEIVWVDTEEIFFSIHTLNAYDVDEERVLVTAERVSDFSMDFEIGKDVENEPNYLWQWQINHKKRKVEWNRQVTSVDGGFPVINEDLHCHPNQFGYVVKTQGDFFNGILKVDSKQGKEIGRIRLPDELEHGEFVFAAKEGAKREDDGYMVGFVTNTTDMKSQFLVFDAKTFSSEPVARVELPQRVPHGFHGRWVPQSLLRED